MKVVTASSETFAKLGDNHRLRTPNRNVMRSFLFVLQTLVPLLASAQISNHNVLLVEHNNAKRQYFYAEGNVITFFTRQGERATGILADITDSTVRVDNRSYRLNDIAKIKRKTASTFAKVIGGIFIFDGAVILASAAAEPDLAGPLVFLGLTSVAIGIPLVAEPSFKVGVNCRLRVATNATYVKRR